MNWIPLMGGFVLDMLFGDPYWMPHPVKAMGKMISRLERGLRARFPKTEKGELLAGGVLALTMISVWFLLPAAVLRLINRVHPLAALVAETFLAYQVLAARCLQTETAKVAKALETGLTEGQKAVSMVVGRDTSVLDETGVVKAAVETIAENTSDGEIAPLFYLALGGVPLAMLYKAVNTMDSMIGYKNDRYLFFGRAAARLDDLLNLIPARLTAVFLSLAAPLCGLDGRRAWNIARRDHARSTSPNSGWCEAACAGALGVQLLGPAVYFGKRYDKPVIGDALRPVERQDIARTNRLMLTASALAALVFAAVRAVL